MIFIVLLLFRTANSDISDHQPRLNITTWDAFGYYLYLPGIILYHDCGELKWVDTVDKKYSVTGGGSKPAEKLANGNYVCKYLGGVALLELPLFATGHAIALAEGYPADGFSAPYEYALAFGVIIYCLLALLLLRRVLLYYFSDAVTAATLLAICLATNFVQYAAVDNGQSHAYIFVLYCLLLYATLLWHNGPKKWLAFAIGYLIGLMTMSRPTEAIALLIPLLWNTGTTETAKEKWALVRRNRNHLVFTIAGGIIGILPQIIYWKVITGSFLYDVGSSWDFLNPHFRVLFGWEKGWFIYTPVALFFIIGMFFMKGQPYRKSVLWFCLLNIYIIIAWRIWRYGGSYSTRALVQSYPLFALPFASLANAIRGKKIRFVFYLLCLYLLAVNLFQTCQYDKTIIHYDDMNRLYYSHVYLNPAPTPLDMSFLDTHETPGSEKEYTKKDIYNQDSSFNINFDANATADILKLDMPANGAKKVFLKITVSLTAKNNLWQSYLNAEAVDRDSVKHTRIRLFNPISKPEEENTYCFYYYLPPHFYHSALRLYLSSAYYFHGIVNHIKVEQIEN